MKQERVFGSGLLRLVLLFVVGVLMVPVRAQGKLPDDPGVLRATHHGCDKPLSDLGKPIRDSEHHTEIEERCVSLE